MLTLSTETIVLVF